jgi:hypothetical protein
LAAAELAVVALEVAALVDVVLEVAESILLMAATPEAAKFDLLEGVVPAAAHHSAVDLC